MLTAPNAKGMSIIPPGVFTPSFSSTSISLGPFSENRKNLKLSEVKPGNTGFVNTPNQVGAWNILSNPSISVMKRTQTVAGPCPSGPPQQTESRATAVWPPLVSDGNYAVTDGVAPPYYVGGDSLVAVVGNLVMMVGSGDPRAPSGDLLIKLFNRDKGDVEKRLRVILPLDVYPTAGVPPFASTVTTADEKVVFIPRAANRFGIYDPITNKFRFLGPSLVDLGSQYKFERACLLTGLSVSGGPGPAPDVVFVPGVYADIKSIVYRPSWVLNPKTGELSIVSEMSKNVSVDMALRTPVAIGSLVFATSRDEDSFEFTVWDTRRASVFTMRPAIRVAKPMSTDLRLPGFFRDASRSSKFIVYSPYPTILSGGDDPVLIWTILDTESMRMAQVVHTSAGGFAGTAPASIVTACDGSIMTLTPGTNPPELLVFFPGITDGTSNTSNNKTYQVYLPPCFYVPATAGLVSLDGEYIFPGGLRNDKGDADVTPDDVFYMKVCEVEEQIAATPLLSCVPISSEKTIFNKTVSGVLVPQARGSYATPTNILPRDNGVNRCLTNIESYPLSWRLINNDSTDYRILQSSQKFSPSFSPLFAKLNTSKQRFISGGPLRK